MKEKYTYINELAAQNVPFLCLIDFEGTELHVWPLDEINPNQLGYHIGQHTNFTPNQQRKQLGQWEVSAPKYSQYQQAFTQVDYHLRRGDSFLLNLTGATKVKSDMSLRQLFEVSSARYKLWLKEEFVCFSPEPFVRIEQGIIKSYPMKGTISAEVPNAEQIILQDEKELEEHVTIVDLIRNDLSQVAHSVVVESFRYTELVHTAQQDLWQVSSCIKGVLQSELGLGDVIQRLLPAGSISGAPKKRTVEIIKKVEQQPRGFFTGIVGIFDGNNFDSGVLIRFVEQNAQGLQYRSGGGITINSTPKKEYQEMIDKVYVPTV